MAQTYTIQETGKIGQTFFRTPYPPSAVTVNGTAIDLTDDYLITAGGFTLVEALDAADTVVATVTVPDSYVGTRAPAVSDLTVVATTGTLPTANGTVTIANAASPTVVELLEYCRELEAKVEALFAGMRGSYLMAS